MIIPKHDPSPFKENCAKIFGEGFKEAPIPSPSAAEAERRNIFLCFSNRSGSEWLSEALASSGEMPRAREIFTFGSGQQAVKKVKTETFPEYCRRIAEQEARNGAFAAKLGLRHLSLLCETGVIPKLYRNNRFLFLRRRDLLGQAISLSLARSTRQWRSDQVEMGGAEFHFGKLQRRIQGLAAKNAHFDAFFAMNGIEPHGIYYEDLLADPAGTVAEIAKFLGAEGVRYVPGEISLRRQEDPRKKEWRERFLEMAANVGA